MYEQIPTLAELPWELLTCVDQPRPWPNTRASLHLPRLELAGVTSTRRRFWTGNSRSSVDVGGAFPWLVEGSTLNLDH